MLPRRFAWRERPVATSRARGGPIPRTHLPPQPPPEEGGEQERRKGGEGKRLRPPLQKPHQPGHTPSPDESALILTDRELSEKMP